MRQTEEMVAARPLVTEGHLTHAIGNLSEMQQASMGQIPVTRVAPATTSMGIERAVSLFFLRESASRTGHTMVTIPSA